MSKKSTAVTTSVLDHDYDTPEGVRAALKAARQGDLSASETLARRLSWIIAGEAPYSDDEIEQLIGVAESGWNSILGQPDCHPEDMYQFAIDILWDDSGDLIRENAENGAAWMLRAAEGNLPDAQLEVGRLYFEGVGVKQSDSLAAEWFKKASSDKLNAEHAGFFLDQISKKSGKKKSAPAAKKSAKKAVAKKAPAKKSAAKSAAKKTSTKKAPAKKVAAKKAPSKKVVVKKAPVKKSLPAAKKAKPVKKAAVKKVAAKKPSAKKTAAKRK